MKRVSKRLGYSRVLQCIVLSFVAGGIFFKLIDDVGTWLVVVIPVLVATLMIYDDVAYEEYCKLRENERR